VCCLQYFWSFPRDLTSLQHPPGCLCHSPHSSPSSKSGQPAVTSTGNHLGSHHSHSGNHCLFAGERWENGAALPDTKGFFKPQQHFSSHVWMQGLRVLPHAPCQRSSLGSANGRGAGRGQRPKACSWAWKRSSAFCRAAPHRPKWPSRSGRYCPGFCFTKWYRKGVLNHLFCR